VRVRRHRERQKKDPGLRLLEKIAAVGVACLDAGDALEVAAEAGIPEDYRQRIEQKVSDVSGAVAELVKAAAKAIKKEDGS
jgi:hypothetical protein